MQESDSFGHFDFSSQTIHRLIILLLNLMGEKEDFYLDVNMDILLSQMRSVKLSSHSFNS